MPEQDNVTVNIILDLFLNSVHSFAPNAPPNLLGAGHICILLVPQVEEHSLECC